MKLFYTADFLVREDYEKCVPHLFNSITFKAIESAGAKVEILSDRFDCKVFLKFGDKNYLKSAIGEALIFGFELSQKTKDLLNEIGVTYVNTWIHPFKLLDDLALAFESNSPQITENLIKFSQPKEKLELYALYWKERIKNTLGIPKIPENCALIIGQSESDQSLVRDGKMLCLNDFKAELDELKKKHHLIYAPHPSCKDRFGKVITKNKPNLARFLHENKPEIVNASTYQLLASNNIASVVAISSSVVSEAKYFGKKSRYLFQPLFDDSICILQDYFYSHFWAAILGTKTVVEVKFDIMQNKIRDMMKVGQLYWGYRELDNVRILLDEKRTRDRSVFGKLVKLIKSR
jgi:hypothetical protein